MIRLGVIGYGYWGPNIVRNFSVQEKSTVLSVCDTNPKRLSRALRENATIITTSNSNDIITSPNIDAVAIVTPVFTHYELARAALENGKHVFVEKPFTANVDQAQELIDLAAKKRLTIMVDHTFLFTSAVKKIKELVEDGTLGELYYYDSTRVNLGLFQHDVNVIWDLAPHDLAVMQYLIQTEPMAVVATGQSHFNTGLEDVAYITVYFPGRIIAHCHVNWLSPVKIRTTLIGGEKKMVVWNDLEPDNKIKVYDKGVEIKNGEGVYKLLISYRSGDMWAPRLDQTEALRVEAEYFVECVEGCKTPINDGVAGLNVVRLLEAADKSIRNRGEQVYL
jgi:predicted dehydrogenase